MEITTLELLSVVTWLIGVVLLAVRMPTSIAIGIVSARILVSYSYFAGWWGKQWTLLDDLNYLNTGEKYLNSGFSTIELLWNQDARQKLQDIVGSEHYVYNGLNAGCIEAFGHNYYATVFINIIIGFVGGELYSQLLERVGFAQKWHSAARICRECHLHYFTWTAMLNLKETLVETCILAMLNCGMALISKRQALSIAMGVLSAILLASLRSYVPAIIASALAIHILSTLSFRWKFLCVTASLFATPYAFKLASMAGIYLQPAQILNGSVQFMLTPRPWGIVDEYSFLVLAATQQWLLIPLAFVGSAVAWKHCDRRWRVILYAAVLFIAFYGAVEELRGPRHRVQFTSLYSFLEFNGLICLISLYRKGSLSALHIDERILRERRRYYPYSHRLNNESQLPVVAFHRY